MNKKQKRVGIAKFEGIDNAYILVSAGQKPPEDNFGDFRVKPLMSFLYDNGEWAAEWEPEFGPIQVWHKADKEDENAREHYYFDYTDSGPINWSQLAVDRLELPKAFHRGDYEYIFAVLRDWARK